MHSPDSPADHIGAHDAKMRLAELLDRVQRGEEIVITRHGRPVARLTGAGPGHDVEAARAAARDLAEIRREIATGPGGSFTIDEILSLRDDGRRY